MSIIYNTIIYQKSLLVNDAANGECMEVLLCPEATTVNAMKIVGITTAKTYASEETKKGKEVKVHVKWETDKEIPVGKSIVVSYDEEANKVFVEMVRRTADGYVMRGSTTTSKICEITHKVVKRYLTPEKASEVMKDRQHRVNQIKAAEEAAAEAARLAEAKAAETAEAAKKSDDTDADAEKDELNEICNK